MNIDELINSMQKEPNYIDLGLPSSTLWGECYVGANIETECGKYFLYPTKTILRKDVSKLWLQGIFFLRSAYSLWLDNSKPFAFF